ncbi:hypothetical protein H2203_005640 [Taxawa tesnikishii (nom. ined.)]|nr:hypothetical protein H2203_005640 [Dothideales sp. JES 119]
MPSVADVLSTYELLELILRYLDVRTLLLAQRVSHFFKAAICTSPLLQQILFFRPVPAAVPKVRMPSTSGAANSASPADHCFTINPLLAQYFIPWFATLYNSQSRNRVFSDFSSLHDLPWNLSGWHKSFFAYPRASWRRMDGGYYCAVATLPFPDGVRMCVVYDITQQYVTVDETEHGFRLFVSKSAESAVVGMWRMSEIERLRRVWPEGETLCLALQEMQTCCVDFFREPNARQWIYSDRIGRNKWDADYWKELKWEKDGAELSAMFGDDMVGDTVSEDAVFEDELFDLMAV